MNKKFIKKKLTNKQQKFCKEYLKDFNGQEAYFRAGYSVKSKKAAKTNASKLLTNANLKLYIEILQKEAEEKFWEYDLVYIIKNAMEIVERCMQHKALTDKDGNPVLTETRNGQLAAAYVFDPKPALGALEFLARLKGWDKPKGGDDNNVHIILTNYLQETNQFNKYFPVTPATEHLAKMLMNNS